MVSEVTRLLEQLEWLWPVACSGLRGMPQRCCGRPKLLRALCRLDSNAKPSRRGRLKRSRCSSGRFAEIPGQQMSCDANQLRGNPTHPLSLWRIIWLPEIIPYRNVTKATPAVRVEGAPLRTIRALQKAVITCEEVFYVAADQPEASYMLLLGLIAGSCRT
ncbi:hypothetical protein KOW79_001931 [Hemibagrus wyckioides]|uniref:Uncharacterized protein n=1 Tax=Hemibagrus wyckioides TaxID=337641 RepID=A0A9D3P5X0_9TELE|nr:hypothetical protein KOW79_001931 [Hemibagrus wyckioides]